MNSLPADMEDALTGSQSSRTSLRDVHSINPTQLMARIESYEGRERKGISDVRRTFCLFVTFDLLFVTLLWIIELNVSGFSRNSVRIVSRDKTVFFFFFLKHYFCLSQWILFFLQMRQYWSPAELDISFSLLFKPILVNLKFILSGILELNSWCFVL